MSTSMPADFSAFYREVYEGKAPFPWQERLARRVCEGNWPRCIALPAAAGKTTCIDIAIFALACQAALPPEKRTAPRRVFFVVDRRVVVDQAYDHAKMLVEAMDKAVDGPCWNVAETLRSLARPEWHDLPEADRRRILGKRRNWKYKKEADWMSGERARFWNDLANDEREWIDVSPLDVYALRGGMYRESAWVRSPLQPTVITSTVDQVGSRLLFRGYGVSDPSKPLHAALVGNDALILLDEAHCAKPFNQTMTLVEKYRGKEWAQTPLPSPFRFVTMTATPSSTLSDDQIERDQEADRAHPVLGARINASKPAALVIAPKAKGNKWREELVKELVTRARDLQHGNVRATGVIVNRVATARETAAALLQECGDTSDVILLTGRMRPIDRDAIMKKIEPLLSGSSEPLDRPTFVVATQCLEVGADLDFHALVTECASLDALRQRFGRLNRVAARPEAKAVLVVRADQTEPTKEDADADPVYGNSLANTWKWLKENAEHDVFDFGVAAVAELTKGVTPDDLDALNAPAPDAAVLLPAHLDMWCQTSPTPVPDPDPAVFLHGPQPSMPDVQVVFRADMVWDEARSREENKETWAEIVSLCPPSSSEALPVRMGVFRNWLATKSAADDSGDVEGEVSPDSDQDGERDASTGNRRALRWRGADSNATCIIESPTDLFKGGRPFDLYVVPIADGMGLETLGDFPNERVTDQGDESFQRARDLAIVRLTPALLDVPQLAGITTEDDELDAKIEDAINSLRTAENDKPELERRPWFIRAADHLAKKSNRAKPRQHPLGGLVIIGKRRLHQFDPTFLEAEDSWVTASGRPYHLTKHGKDVARLARRSAERTGLVVLATALELAGLLHDVGKADPRFQAMMHGGNRRKADLYPHLLAKSIVPMPTPHDRRDARDRAGYPRRGRHELLSVRLAENIGALPTDLSSDDRDLLLHLIASHHGYCRPFAPLVEDQNPTAFSCEHAGRPLSFSPDHSTISGHGLERLDSGVAERFWKLTRRFGWWGLPWLESMLRLADWSCSEPAPENSEPANDRDAEPRRIAATEGAS